MKVVNVVDIPHGYRNEYPFKNGDHLLMLGEIENMPGHVAVVLNDGSIAWGYHDDYFEEVEE